MQCSGHPLHWLIELKRMPRSAAVGARVGIAQHLLDDLRLVGDGVGLQFATGRTPYSTPYFRPSRCLNSWVHYTAIAGTRPLSVILTSFSTQVETGRPRSIAVEFIPTS